MINNSNTVTLIILAVAIFFVIFVITRFIKVIPQNMIGIKRRNIGTPSQNGVISINGSVGYSGKVLTPGIYFILPIVSTLTKVNTVSIPDGEMGFVFSRTGKTLDPQQKTGATVPGVEEFQDVNIFLSKGGQKGIQRRVLKAGVYPQINTTNFIVITKSEVYGHQFLSQTELNSILQIQKSLNSSNNFTPITINSTDDRLLTITTLEGRELNEKEVGVVAPTIPNHQQFQDFDAFIRNGGYKGKQEQVLLEGTYFLNPFSVQLQMYPKTIIEKGEVGVQLNYTGPSDGKDVSGTDFRHGSLVEDNQKGISKKILEPGKYAINPLAREIIKVPTKSILLKWKDNDSGSNLDSNLSSISLTTKDGFQILLPLSVVFNIDYENAPKVIARFGTVEDLIDRVLDSFVSATFKDIGQQKDLLDIYQNRKELNDEVSKYIAEEFSEYNLVVSRVLVDTPRFNPGNPAENIIANLQNRKISKENIVTSIQRQEEQEQVKIENEKRAIADMQVELTNKDIQKEITQKEQEAQVIVAQQQKQKAIIQSEQEVEVKKREQEKNKIQLEIQKANAENTAEIDKTQAQGQKLAIIEKAQGQAKAIELVAEANKRSIELEYGNNPELKVQKDIAVANVSAIKTSAHKLVPETVVNMGGKSDEQNSDLIKAMLLNNMEIGKTPKISKI